MNRTGLNRWTRLLITALLAGVGISTIVFAVSDWHLHDMQVYEAAAWRIRNGEPLYGGDVDQLSAYRYSPWFAYAWLPFTYLPPTVVRVLWSALMVAATALAVAPLVRDRAVYPVLLFGPILIGISAIGNVHPAMMAVLMWGIPRRWGGLAVGLAASLKVVPILLILHFVAERRWTQAGVAIVVAAALWLPILLFDIAPVSFDPGAARTLAVPVWILVGAFGVAGATWLGLRRSRYSGLAAGTAALLALPRLFVYEISLVMVGTIPVRRRDSRPESGDEI